MPFSVLLFISTFFLTTFRGPIENGRIAFVMNRTYLILFTCLAICFSSCGKIAEVESEPVAEQKLSDSESKKKWREAAKADLLEKKLFREKLINERYIELEAARKAQPIKTGNAKRFETIEAYFKDGNPKPISHRLGLPRYERRVSNSTKQKVKNRDGNCCLVCGSTINLEVDHRIALMNGGDNEINNLGTLCDDCHNKKTRLDYRVRKQREKEALRR